MIFPFCLPVPSGNQEADNFTAKNQDTLYKTAIISITNKDWTSQEKKQSHNPFFALTQKQ